MRALRLLALSAAALSGSAMAEHVPRPLPAQPAGWDFSLSPYIWAAGMKGDVGQLGLPAATVKAGFSDVLSHLDMSFMAAFEARQGPYSLVGDLFYAKVSLQDSVSRASAHRPPLAINEDIKVNSKAFSGFLGGGYSLLANPLQRLDIIAGVRAWSASTETFYQGTRSGSVYDSASWMDAVVGLKGSRALTGKFYVTGWGMVGAGQARSDWDVMAAVGYRIKDQLSLTAGYRAMGVNYRRGGFVYDVIQRGPIAGMSYQF